MSAEPTPPTPRIEWTVSWPTLLKVMLAIVLALILYRLWPLLIPLFIALLLAMTLTPVLRWFEGRGWPRWFGTLVCAVLLFGLVIGFVSVLVPTVTNQGTTFIQKLPEFKTALVEHAPGGSVRASVERMLNSDGFTDPAPLLTRFVAWGGLALEGVVELFLVLIIAIYFLVDGERTYEWLMAFLPERQRGKMAQAAPEFVSVVGHYVGGQFIVSTLCGAYTFTVLSVFRIPNAALLAVLAAVFDVLPIIGISVSSVLAMLVALTVSPATALWVGMLYGVYHMIESYLVLPRVYGNRLRLSALTVLLSCLAAVLILGYVGAILALPLVASYPIVERIWLKPYLERDTVKKHAELEKAAE